MYLCARTMKRFLFAFLLLCMTVAVHAQSLQGTVLDLSKQPIPGVTVRVVNNSAHAHTNGEGQFTLEGVSLGDTLRFSHIGFEEHVEVVTQLSTPLVVLMSPSILSLEAATIGGGLDALRVITDVDVAAQPVNSSQEVLRKVPGLFIGQHAGGGKAEQLFLRGFDIDHGTDVRIGVDGIPVNMVSHAHGQGYADLHFLIPETIERIDFGKGPYHADQGNFATAGYVNFETKKRLDHSQVRVELGQFNTRRVLGMLNLLNTSRSNAYVASAFTATDGPFESSQLFSRMNVMGKFTYLLNASDELGVTFSHFTSTWDASGQIPTRAVLNGTIGRFGAIDDTEGGNTSRTNLLVTHRKALPGGAFVKSRAYASTYDFELYSNFTFFLEDSLNGDQIRQREDRTLFGFASTYTQPFGNGHLWRAGVDLRHDESRDNALSHTRNRTETLEHFQLGDIWETNLSGFADLTLNRGKFQVNAGVRVDHFDFQYQDQLTPAYDRAFARKAIVSPKLNVFYNLAPDAQVYLKTGRGFHSNDTRVILSETGRRILPAATGADLGTLWKPLPRLLLNVAYWYLHSEQEFVYVGDAGIVEPSGASVRHGADVSARYQLGTLVYLNVDVNYARARSVADPEGENFIPLAPALTAQAGVGLRTNGGFVANLNARHIADRPANEDNSIVAEGYTVVDANVSYTRGKLEVGVQVQNLFDVDWNETQFATLSQLAGEDAPVEEIHFTPGTPFFARGMVTVRF